MLITLFLSCSYFAENFPPRILTGPTEVNITVNETATIIVTAEDPNNDSLTFTLSGTLPTGYTTTSDASSITLTWRVTSEEVTVCYCKSQFVFSLVWGASEKIRYWFFYSSLIPFSNRSHLLVFIFSCRLFWVFRFKINFDKHFTFTDRSRLHCVGWNCNHSLKSSHLCLRMS